MFFEVKRYYIFVLGVVALGLSSMGQTIPRDSVSYLAGRMLMVGFKGDSIAPDNPVVSYLRDVRVGGIILFDVDLTGSRRLGSRNITSSQQLKRLTEDLRNIAGYPLLIAADQEGGLVQRLKPEYGFESIPSARYLGGVANPDTTEFWGNRIAEQLVNAGINMNLAPEVDLHRDNCPVIGGLDRSFSGNPDSVVFHAGIMIDAFHSHGIRATLKHFPGHGSATADSHYGLTDVTLTWHENELEPFRQLIDCGKADAIMTAHIFNRNIDADYPATLSHKIITGLLRQKLGYDGLIITDDLYMQGIIDNYSIEQALILAINAGVDMIIVGNNITTGFEPDRPARLVKIIVDAVEDGKIPVSRLIEANRRIDALHGELRK